MGCVIKTSSSSLFEDGGRTVIVTRWSTYHPLLCGADWCWITKSNHSLSKTQWPHLLVVRYHVLLVHVNTYIYQFPPVLSLRSYMLTLMFSIFFLVFWDTFLVVLSWRVVVYCTVILICLSNMKQYSGRARWWYTAIYQNYCIKWQVKSSTFLHSRVRDLSLLMQILAMQIANICRFNMTSFIPVSDII